MFYIELIHNRVLNIYLLVQKISAFRIIERRSSSVKLIGFWLVKTYIYFLGCKIPFTIS